MHSSAPDHTIPLRLPSDDDSFVALRTLLAKHGFTDVGVNTHTGSESLYDFFFGADRANMARAAERPFEHALDLLVRLFMQGEAIDRAAIDTLLGDDALTLLESLGLIRASGTGERVIATVLMYPTEGPWLVSDRSIAIARAHGLSASAIPADAVYPAVTGSVRVFLCTLPLGQGGDFLELCSGTGIAALMGAMAGAEHAYAVDITERSTVFAEFNARLNGLQNFTALQGDLWEPVRGKTFDTIVAHPPYVPSVARELIYRDGGEDGEQVTRAILGGLHAHLAPGGVFHCTCVISSREGSTPAQRVRAMIGEHADAYDLVYVRNGSNSLVEHFASSLMSSDAPIAARTGEQVRRLAELQVERVEFATIVLKRHNESRTGFTFVASRGSETGWREVAWALRAGAAATRPAVMAQALLRTPIRIAAGARLELSYRVGVGSEDRWVAERGHISVETPFVGRVDVGAGDAMMLAQFDGTRTLHEHLLALKADGALPAETDEEQFALSFSQLVLDGIVESAAFVK